jgi:hypothetical protein
MTLHDISTFDAAFGNTTNDDTTNDDSDNDDESN